MATSWTQADIDALEDAIASGVKTVSYAGPPQRTITYQDLDAMRRALADMKRQVNGAPRMRLAKHRQGFR